MEQHKIDRISELSRLSRERALTAEEAAEREALRGEYRASVRQSLQAHLDNTYLVNGQGRNKSSEGRGSERRAGNGSDGEHRPGGAPL